MTEVTSGGISSADIASARASLRGAFGSGEPEATTTLPATSLTPESRFNLSGIAKATAERLRNIGGGLAYVATHPAMWPGIAWSGAKGWGENMIHPLNVAKQVIVDKKPLTKDELFWVAGAIEGAVETFVVYNSLPPGLARLTRAGASLAFGQAPMLVSYIREIREKGEAAKAGATAEEIKDIEQRHTRAAGFIKSFSRGRAAGGAVRMFTAFGALEILGEKGFEAVGIDPGQVVQKGFSKARGGIVGADQQVLELARVNEALSSDDFRNAANIINSAPDFNQQLVLLDNQTIKEALDGLGLKTENLSDEALEQIKQATITKTNIWSDNHLVEGTREALLADPQLHVGQAVLIGKQHVIDSLQKLKDDPNAYQQFIEERKVIINQALQEEKDRIIVETTPTSTSTATATTTAIATSTPAPAVQEPPKVVPDVASAGASPVGINQMDLDNFLKNHPAFQTAKAAAVGARENLVDEEFVSVVKDLGLDEKGMSDQTIAAIKQKFHQKMLHTLEAKANEYFDPKVEAVMKNGISLDQAKEGSRRIFIGDLDNVDSELRQTIHKQALDAVKTISLDETRAAMVGAHMDQIDQATDQAIAKLGITEEVSTQTRQAIHDSLQGEAQDLANHSLDQEHFQHDLSGVLEHSIFNVHADDIVQNTKVVMAGALEHREATSAVISEDTLGDMYEKIAAVDSTDLDSEHLNQVIHQAATEGLKEHLIADEGIREQIANVIDTIPHDHITSVDTESVPSVSHIFAQADQALNYTPQDARKLAAFIAINEKELADMHYAFEATETIPQDGYFPVTLDHLYDIMLKAENGDEEARRRLMEAVWWIQKGHTLTIMSLADQARIIEILQKTNK